MADKGPYLVIDINSPGQTTARGIYSAAPTWTGAGGVLSGDGYAQFASSASSNNRKGLVELSYDDLGRPFQRLDYAIAAGTGNKGNQFKTLFYYDRRGRNVAQATQDQMATEHAYDGLERRFESRRILKVKGADSGSYYTSGAFNYRSPLPNSRWSSTGGTFSGSDDKVMTMAHRVFDANWNVVETHAFDANHDDTDGIDPSTHDDYVRRSVYHWYDIADRPTTAASYGSGNGVNSADTWKYNAPKARNATAPTVSSDYELVTSYTYHDSSAGADIDDSGRLLEVKDPEGIITRYLHDRLGRRRYVVRRYTDFQSPTTGIGGGTDNDQDFVTMWEYNGLHRVAKLTAYNGSGSASQVTEYLYTNIIDASWPTLVKYPDGSTSGSDNVQCTYHVDGRPNTRTDQRGTVIEYGYDPLRRWQAEKVNALGGADGTILAITRGYDALGRVSKVTSHGNATTDPNNTADVRNQIVYTYNDLHQITKSEQNHSGVVGAGTLSVQYAYDLTAPSGFFDDGARLESGTYPNGRVIFNTYGTAGGVDDQLNRPKEIRKTSATGTILAEYQWTAANRLVHTDYGVTAGQPDVRNSFHANDNDDDYEAYDRFGRVKFIDWYRYGGTVTSLDKYLYTYDRADNRKTRDLDALAVSGAPTNRDQAYIYDQLYRLKNFDEGTLSGGTIASPVYEQDFTLEQLGNWSKFDEKSNSSYTLKQARSHNSVNEIDTDNDHSNGPGDSITLQMGGPGANWIDPKYDAAGNLIEAPKPGAETTRHKYDYDAWNRLAKVRDNAGTILLAFAYDGLNRRTTKVDLVSAKTYEYYHDEAWRVIEVRRKIDPNPLDPDPHEQFVWHPYYLDALAIRFYDAATNGTVVEHYYGHDGNFNVTVVHDVSGNVQERYAYSPYGKLTIMNASFTVISSSAIANSYTYTGREYDAETGLFHYRHRYYHAQLGLFVARDPIRYRARDVNLYRYVFNAVLSRLDPFGLFDFDMDGRDDDVLLLDDYSQRNEELNKKLDSIQNITNNLEKELKEMLHDSIVDDFNLKDQNNISKGFTEEIRDFWDSNQKNKYDLIEDVNNADVTDRGPIGTTEVDGIKQRKHHIFRTSKCENLVGSTGGDPCTGVIIYDPENDRTVVCHFSSEDDVYDTLNTFDFGENAEGHVFGNMTDDVLSNEGMEDAFQFFNDNEMYFDYSDSAGLWIDQDGDLYIFDGDKKRDTDK